MTGKDAGKQGVVAGIVRERNWIFVQGLNCVCCFLFCFTLIKKNHWVKLYFKLK
jgi:hypothetical protein